MISNANAISSAVGGKIIPSQRPLSFAFFGKKKKEEVDEPTELDNLEDPSKVNPEGYRATLQNYRKAYNPDEGIEGIPKDNLEIYRQGQEIINEGPYPARISLSVLKNFMNMYLGSDWATSGKYFPYNPFASGRLRVDRSAYKQVKSFTEEGTEGEFKKDLEQYGDGLEARSQTFRLMGPYGARVMVINESGQPINGEKFWDILENEEGQKTLRKIIGVELHELSHRAVSGKNPYIQQQGFREIIRIYIRNGKDGLEAHSRGTADVGETLESTIKMLEGLEDGSSEIRGMKEFVEYIGRGKKEINGIWPVFVDRMQNFNKDLQSAGKNALEFCNKTLAYLDYLTNRKLPAVKAEYDKLSYWAQNMVVAAVAPLVLIYNFPVHAGTISPQDNSIKDAFMPLMYECLSHSDRIDRRIETVKIMRARIAEIKRQIEAGRSPSQVSLDITGIFGATSNAALIKMPLAQQYSNTGLAIAA